MKKNLIILNGKIAFNEELRDAVLSFRTRGYVLDVRVTWERGDAANFARCDNRSYQRVIVAGGDGTLSEVANGLMKVDRELRPLLGLIPMGTANDFAVANKIPDYIHDALELALTGEARNIDLIKINDDYAINMATLGFGTQISVNTNQNLKNIIGGAAYLFSGFNQLYNLSTSPIELKSKHFNWRGNYLGLALGNSSQAGGGLVFCPGAQLDDGLMEVALLPEIDVDQRFEVFSGLLINGIDSLSEYALFSQVEELEILLSRPHQMNIDGEPITSDRFRVRIEPGCLGFVATDL